jgi:hypothetical protein
MRFGSLSRVAGEKQFPAVSAPWNQHSGARPQRSLAVPYLVWNQLIAYISIYFLVPE